MKFDYCIGNPPYHYEAGRRKIPIYQHFIQACTSGVANVVSFVTPDGFIKGGQQLEPLREYMINGKHLKSVIFHKDKIFSGAAVEAAITMFDNRVLTDEIRKVIVHEDGTVESGILDWYYRDVIVDDTKYKVLQLFTEKVKAQDGGISSRIPPMAVFGLNSKCFRENKEKFKLTIDDKHTIKILVEEDKNDFYYINPNDDFSYEGSDGRIEKVKLGQAEKWKMAFPKAGTVREKCVRTKILKPYEIFTDKYLCIFGDTEEQALNAQKYFNSKFYRAGLDSKMTSWIMYASWHSNIPLQDFTSNSDIDWSKSPHEIDMQLYHKYNFTQAEIDLVERYING